MRGVDALPPTIFTTTMQARVLQPQGPRAAIMWNSYRLRIRSFGKFSGAP